MGDFKQEPRYWYLVSSNSANGKYGCAELDCALPWAAGDLPRVIEHLSKRNPTAVSLCVVAVIPIDTPRISAVMDA